jgi:hypothetical protein
MIIKLPHGLNFSLLASLGAAAPFFFWTIVAMHSSKRRSP